MTMVTVIISAEIAQKRAIYNYHGAKRIFGEVKFGAILYSKKKPIDGLMPFDARARESVSNAGEPCKFGFKCIFAARCISRFIVTV